MLRKSKDNIQLRCVNKYYYCIITLLLLLLQLKSKHNDQKYHFPGAFKLTEVPTVISFDDFISFCTLFQDEGAADFKAF